MLSHNIIYTSEYALVLSPERLKPNEYGLVHDTVMSYEEILEKHGEDVTSSIINSGVKIIAHRPLKRNVKFLNSIQVLPPVGKKRPIIFQSEVFTLFTRDETTKIITKLVPASKFISGRSQWIGKYSTEQVKEKEFYV